MKSSNKLIRITTVPVSLSVLLKDQLRYMSDHFEVLAVSSPDKMLEQVGVREGVRRLYDWLVASNQQFVAPVELRQVARTVEVGKV